MASQTEIQWADSTWNCWRGCKPVSEGCAHCYARTLVNRFGGDFSKRVRSAPDTFNAPLKWNKKPWVCDKCGTTRPDNVNCMLTGEGANVCRNNTFHRRRVFSLSLGDWLDPEVPVEWLADMLDVIRRCPDLDFLLLTKRPELWAVRMEAIWHHATHDAPSGVAFDWLKGNLTPANIWLGTTVENQEAADRRIPELLRIPAKVRFLSVEPLLEPIALQCALPASLSDADDQFVDWVIVGGESGPKARPCNVEWIRSIVKQCADASVPCFVKQMGSHCITRNDDGFEGGDGEWPMGTHTSEIEPVFYQGAPVRVRLRTGAGANPLEWPADLRVQQFPTVSR